MKTKRIVSLLICAVMVLSMIPAMSISSSAAVDGLWTTYRFASEYPQPDDDPGEEVVYRPEAGYKYTSEGFTVVPADYKDTTPAMTIITKEPQPIKEGIYLEFRVDDYSYDGGTGADQWICLSLSTQEKVNPGVSTFGGGWLTLIRGAGAGNALSIPHLTDPKTETFGGTFVAQGGGVSITADMDDEGREIYTLEVNWTGSQYEILVNGVAMPSSAQTTELLERLNSAGDFYVGISAHASVSGGQAAFTILKYGTSKATATKPVGDDKKDPEPNEMTIADIAPADSVPVNTPAILWDPANYNLRNGNNINFTPKGDNTWAAQATEAAVFFQFSPKRSWSYAAEDFPVFGIMFRNLWIDSGMLWYAAGEVMSPQNDCNMAYTIYEGEFYGEDDEYIFVPYDLYGLWEGRINAVRLDFAMGDESVRDFDICFAGMFRTVGEAYAYAEAWIADVTGELPGDDTVVDDTAENVDETVAGDVEETTFEAEETTAAEVEATTAAADETRKPTEETAAGGDETQKPAEETTAAPAEATTAADGEETEAEEKKSGCGAVVGFGAVAVLAAAAAAVALKKKD